MNMNLRTRALAILSVPVFSLSLLTVATPSVAAEPRQTPERGDCYLASPSSLEDLSNPYPAIDCSLPHNLETYYVGQWTQGDPYTQDPEQLWPLAAEICGQGRPERYLGIKLPSSPASRVYWYYFFPTQEQWEAGERWISCEVGLQRGWSGLQTVSGTMKSLMERQGVLGWAYCTKARPNKASAQAPVPCSSTSRPWILARSTKLKGSNYPGDTKAGNEATAFCKLVAQRESSLAKPDWLVWWSGAEEWQRDRAGFAWCYMNLAETRWR